MFIRDTAIKRILPGHKDLKDKKIFAGKADSFKLINNFYRKILVPRGGFKMYNLIQMKRNNAHLIGMQVIMPGKTAPIVNNSNSSNAESRQYLLIKQFDINYTDERALAVDFGI